MKTSPQADQLQTRLNNNIASATRMSNKLQQELSNCQNEQQKQALIECWNMATNDHERQEVLDAWRGVRTTESTRMLDRLKSWLSSER